MKGDRFIKSKHTVLNVDDIVTANYVPNYVLSTMVKDEVTTAPRLAITVRGYQQHIYWNEEATQLWNQLQQLDTTWDELMPY